MQILRVRIGLIFNPSARGDKARSLRSQLDGIAGECILMPTEGPGHAEDLAEQAIVDGYEMLVAAGGDGTLHEVANGLVRHPDGLKQVSLGILPMGTVNVMARELKVPLDFEAAWRVIRRGYSEWIDLPWMELQNEGQTQKRCFPALAGAGLDARACELVDWETKKRSGQLAYITAGFRAVSEEMPTFRVQASERVIESAELIMLGNGHMYGGPFDVFPRARLNDGKVDAIVAERVEKWRALQYGQALLTGNLPGLDGVHYLQSETFELIPEGDKRVSVQLDGDAMGALPGKITVQALGLRMVMPIPQM